MTLKPQKLDDEYQTLLGECNILKRRLDSKTEALLILSRELDKNRSERDQYKLMAHQLRDRYNALKKRIEGWGPSLLGVYDVRGFKDEREQSLVQLLCELKEQNKSLQFEVNDLKQKLGDAQGDIKLLREQIARQRVGSSEEGVTIRHFPAYEREDLVKQLEIARQKCSMLEKDLQAVLDEKEELVTARDAYRHKMDRLNHQLNCMLRGDEHLVVDIDAVLMDNRFLQERLRQVQEEKAMMAATLAKYKSVLEKKRSRNGVRLNTLGNGVITNKQVQQLLQSNPFLELTNNPNTVSDLRNLVVALFESLNDKTLALSHQKKTNKILGNRVTELEKKIKTIEISNLWNVQDSAKLCADENCCTEETVSQPNSPSHNSVSVSSNTSAAAISNINEDDIIPEQMTGGQENILPEIDKVSTSGSGFSDLDLLPTKESPFPSDNYIRSSSSCSSHLSSSQSSTPPQSPFHENQKMHGNSEVMSSNIVKEYERTHHLNERSDNVDDDLPPQLQKLLDEALAEIEQSQMSKRNLSSNSVSNSNNLNNVHNQETETDPNC